MRSVVFVPLAQNQADFFLETGALLRAAGWQVGFMSFHEPSQYKLRQAGFASVNPYDLVDPALRVDEAGAQAIAAEYGIGSLKLLISHEQAAYQNADAPTLYRKAVQLLRATEAALSNLREQLGGDPVVVQELGGFLSVAATYYSACRLGLEHVYLEPSFFKGRTFFTDHGVAAPRPEFGLRPAASEEVRQYLEQSVSRQSIVIPAKDQRHYRTAWAKVFDARNMRRLLEKSWEKYVKGQREEFSYIGGHVRRHISMALTGQRIKRFYTPLPQQPFIYYPLHVPADVALTIRAPAYWDQYALLDYIARIAPAGVLVVTKEHPALIGAVNASRITDLLKRHSNIRLLDPGINNYTVLSKAACVVTVNSKSGAEAILLNRPVIALGDSFYRGAPLIRGARALDELPGQIEAALADRPRPRADIESFFQSVWDHSLPGELFLNEPANNRVFADSLMRHLTGSKVPTESRRVFPAAAVN